jgi:hypothetical protein
MSPVLPLAVGNRAGYAQNSRDRQIVEDWRRAAAIVARFPAALASRPQLISDEPRQFAVIPAPDTPNDCGRAGL